MIYYILNLITFGLVIGSLAKWTLYLWTPLDISYWKLFLAAAVLASIYYFVEEGSPTDKIVAAILGATFLSNIVYQILVWLNVATTSPF